MRTILLALTAAALLTGADHDPNRGKRHLDYNLQLWPEGKVPGAIGNEDLDKPFLTVVQPDNGTANGSAIIICPGGGNIKLFYHPEGMAVAEHLNSWGVTAFILTYRLAPRYPNEEARILDGQRAIRLVRARAADWKLDPNRIGLMGFSAGSNMGRTIAGVSLGANVNAADAVDRVSSRPDFVALVYGPGRAAPGESLKDFPPAFLLAAAADPTSAGTAQLFLDLRKAGASAELHIYQHGRHGFGAAETDPGLSDWMLRCKNWMQQAGFFRSVGR